MADDVARDLVDVVEGDLARLDTMLETPHQVLEATAHRLPPLTVMRESVARVIDALLGDEISAQKAQLWASFVRRGYSSQTGSTPIAPIDIPFDPAHEDAIAEAVSRLDEIGDAIDGTLTREELESLRRLLRSPS